MMIVTPDTLDYVSRLLYKMQGPRQDHDDLVQETLLRAFTSKRVLRKRSLKSWLAVLAKQVVIDAWRYQTRDKRTGEEVHEWDLPVECDPTIKIELDQLLPKLPPILLEVMDGKSYKEIGESMGITEKAAKCRVLRARALLTSARE